MIRLRRWTLAAICCAGTAISCSRPDAAPVPAPVTSSGPPPAYMAALSESGQAAAAAAAAARALGPCSFLDEPAVKRINDRPFFGPARDPGSCLVTFPSVTGLTVTFTLAMPASIHHAQPPERATVPRQHAGIWRGNPCLVTVRLADRTVGYTVRDPDPGQACPRAVALAASSARLLKGSPPRARSPYLRTRKLERLDPCSALPVTDARPVLEDAGPYMCVFRPDGPASALIEVVSDNLISTPPEHGAIPLDIERVPSWQTQTDATCILEVPLGRDDAFPAGSMSARVDPTIGGVRVSGQDCAAAHAAAVRLALAYHGL